jgi:hypothetical protein
MRIPAFIQSLISPMKNSPRPIFVALGLLMVHTLHGAPITYFDSDFENGTLGGGSAYGYPFGSPVNMVTPELDGRGLFFSTNAQAIWRINGPQDNLQYVGLDFHAMQGANLTMFLDAPRILRTDVDLEGRHRLDVFYDLSTRIIESYLDGVLSPELLTFAAWSSSIDINSVRISNQILSPGNSTGAFKVDNFIWQGGVTASNVMRPTRVPDSGSTIFLMAIALSILGFLCKYLHGSSRLPSSVNHGP